MPSKNGKYYRKALKKRQSQDATQSLFQFGVKRLHRAENGNQPWSSYKQVLINMIVYVRAGRKNTNVTNYELRTFTAVTMNEKKNQQLS